MSESYPQEVEFKVAPSVLTPDLTALKNSGDNFPYGEMTIYTNKGPIFIPFNCPVLAGYTSAVIPVTDRQKQEAQYALKTPKDLKPGSIDRFETERFILRTIRPLLAPQLLDDDQKNIRGLSIPWTLVEYLPGVSLDKFRFKEKLTDRELAGLGLKVISDISLSLLRLHEKNWIFNDSIVQNVMLGIRQGGKPTDIIARAFDFGNCLQFEDSPTNKDEPAAKDVLRLLDLISGKETFISKVIRSKTKIRGRPIEDFADYIRKLINGDSETKTAFILEEILLFTKKQAINL